MADTPARIGVIGAGWWAAVNHIPVLQRLPDCALVAASRLGVAECAALQREFAIPEVFEDAAEMLRTVRLDGVVVSSPHPLHHAHATAALQAGCHVLVEKPMPTTAADARDLVRTAAHAGREILVANGWNFRPWTEQARAMLAGGGIGHIEHGSLHMASALADLFAGEPMQETADALFRPPASTWADPQAAGGYGWGQLVHALALLFRITGLRPEAVFATMGRSPAGVDYYDAAVLRCVGGATVSLSGAATVPKHRGFQLDLRLFGTDGMLLLDIERARLEVRRRDTADVVVPLSQEEVAYECEAPLRALVDVCLGRPTLNAAPGLVGQYAVEVLDAMYRSARSGRMEAV